MALILKALFYLHLHFTVTIQFIHQFQLQNYQTKKTRRQANIKEYSEDIFFTIGSATIRKAEAEKVKQLAQGLR